MSREHAPCLVSTALAAALLLAFVGSAMAAEGPPDVIGQYTVNVAPQADGSLTMQYALEHYCASTDFPAGTQYLEVGVPNANFSILDFGPKDWVTSAERNTSGGSWVHLNFARLPKKGDCFDVTFSIRQNAMAYSQGNDLSFQFIPGWFDFATIQKLTIVWALPGDSSLVRGLDPKPISIDDNQAVWVAEHLAPNQKYSVALILGKAAYPDFRQPAPPPAPAAAAASSSTHTGSAADGGSPIPMVILIIIAVGAIIGFASLPGGDGYGSYGGGGSRPSWGGGSRDTWSSGSSHRSSSSCVHSSCVRSSCARSCACACAGGGRVGCSRKEFAYHIQSMKRSLNAH